MWRRIAPLILAAASRVGAMHLQQRGLVDLDGQPALPLVGSERPMPANGFGTCCRAAAQGPKLIESAKAFLALGGRHIDTAQRYRNHQDLKVAIRESGVPREELWLTSKVKVPTLKDGETWTLGEEGVLKAVKETLSELGVSYIDLMLLHHPAPTLEERVAEWRGLLAAKSAGLARNIGVSNYDQEQIEGLISATGVAPSVNQISYHPRVGEQGHALVRWCQSQGVAITAYASLRNLVGKEKAAQVASARQASASAVLLRWALDRGVAVIPGATSAEHIQENFLGTNRLEPLTAEEARMLET